MKVGVIGAGGVGAACLMAMVLRASAREIIIVDRTAKRAKAVATDIRYGVPLGPRLDITEGDYADLAGAALVMITAGVNEKAGGATDRGDPEGRLKLVEKNAAVYRDIIPRIVSAAPDAVLLAVTDPPDPLARPDPPARRPRCGAQHRHLARQPAIPHPHRPQAGRQPRQR